MGTWAGPSWRIMYVRKKNETGPGYLPKPVPTVPLVVLSVPSVPSGPHVCKVTLRGEANTGKILVAGTDYTPGQYRGTQGTAWKYPTVLDTRPFWGRNGQRAPEHLSTWAAGSGQ